jgi:hypothetical protein
MVFVQADVGVAGGARFPAWEFLSILHGFIKDVDWASPDMAFLELGMGPASLREEIMGRKAVRWIRHVIVKEDGMFDGQGPKFARCSWVVEGARKVVRMA